MFRLASASSDPSRAGLLSELSMQMDGGLLRHA